MLARWPCLGSPSGPRPAVSAVPALKLLHEVDERVDALSREGVVDRGADAADRAVALQAVEARRPSPRRRSCFSSSSDGRRNVTFIRERLAGLRRGRGRSPRIRRSRRTGSPAFSALRRGRSPRGRPPRAQPPHRQPHDVDAEHGRRVVERVLLRVRVVVEHRRQVLRRAREQVVAQDDERHAGRAEVLLRAGVDQRRSVRTSIGRLKMSDEASQTSGTAPASGSRGHSRSVDRVVRREVDVGGAGIERAAPRLRDLARSSPSRSRRRSWTVPTFWASLTAFCDQTPVTM